MPVPATFLPRAPEALPDEPAFVDISFVRGVPTTLNGVSLALTELAASLGTLAATHGVGSTRTEGLLCQAPAAVLLHAAHRELTRVATPEEMQRFSATASAAYVDVIERSQWFSSFRDALDAYFGVAQARVNGTVRLRLFKGGHETIGSELMQPPADGAATLRLVPSSVKH
jgi:argininosuccinate synthase